MFISNKKRATGEESTINFNHVCNVVLNKPKKRIEFYFDTMTARENWDYESEKDAEEAYNEIKTYLQGKEV